MNPELSGCPIHHNTFSDNCTLCDDVQAMRLKPKPKTVEELTAEVSDLKEKLREFDKVVDIEVKNDCSEVINALLELKAQSENFTHGILDTLSQKSKSIIMKWYFDSLLNSKEI